MTEERRRDRYPLRHRRRSESPPVRKRRGARKDPETIIEYHEHVIRMAPKLADVSQSGPDYGRVTRDQAFRMQQGIYRARADVEHQKRHRVHWQKHGKEPNVDELLKVADQVEKELIADEPARQRDELRLRRGRGVLERRPAETPHNIVHNLDAGEWIDMGAPHQQPRPPPNDIASLIEDFMG
jgi:hypothetical protein